MKHYRCECGKVRFFGSDSPQPCQGCDDCGTTLAQSPTMHKERIPHHYTTEEMFRDGVKIKTRVYCTRCLEEVL